LYEKLIYSIFKVCPLKWTRLIKSAKEFKDYERIRDYLVIGTLMWLIGIFGYDSSLRNAGMCIYGYGLLLLLYNHYRKGYEEGLNVRKSGGNSS